MTGNTETLSPAKGPGTYDHRALFFEDEKDFLATTVPFLQEGVEADEVVMAVVTPDKIKLLQDALGPIGQAVQFADGTTWYQHPVQAMAAYDAFIKSQALRPIRLVAESNWEDRKAHEVVEWLRYDAIVNAAFRDNDVRCICCFDRRALHPDHPEILEYARYSHPELMDAGIARNNDEYLDPGSVSERCDRQFIEPSPASAASMQIEPTGLHAVRDFVAQHAQRHHMAAKPLRDLIVAVTEVASNAIRHGTAPITVKVWTADGGLFCEVVDAGQWHPDALVGYLPPRSAADPGFGLWGVRMLCDVVNVRATSEGTTVRLRTQL
ncbi:sensor histidine kinase [Spirillospora sp. NPDC048819]|uniref:sensor histidine kinase n=1 Tax=Spirillospora sp. NPDC048819 TaxID=3155268 RepID=UPI0033E55888